MRLKKLIRVSGLLAGTSGLLSFATVALSEEVAAPAAPAAETASVPSSFVSDGSVYKFDQGRASITPVKGWNVEPKGSGMALVMKEVLPAPAPNAPKDYSQPLFARNITVMTINESSPIDEQRAVEFQEQFTKMAQKQGSMPDLQFTSHKFFNFKRENDGLVFFTQHTSNGFTMMQMHILVSGDSKQYLLTYNDLANRFSNQESYDQAWKSMASIDVQGVAPVRYIKEAKIGGAIAAGFLFLVLPFAFARFMSRRRLNNLVSSLQDEWDSGVVSGNCSNVSALESTRVAGRVRGNKKRKPDISDVESFESSVSSFGSNFISTHKSKFATEM